MNEAPLHNDVADAPEGGQATWLVTSDSLRIRVAHWRMDNAKGTVLIFPGRTEFIEKYGRAAGEFAARGYASAVIDWRGQGLADRLAPDRGLGHVKRFRNYQLDVQAMVEFAEKSNLPRPYFLLAHSMGGCIGLEALYQGLDVNAVAFSAPMWGMEMSPWLRVAAWSLTTAATAIGQTERVVPGQTTDNYLGRTTLSENLLTADAEFFEHMENQLRQHPELGIGGPSTNWLHEALLEMQRLSVRPSPKFPCVTFLGTDEKIVDPRRIRKRMAKWPNGKLTVINGARHEPMMDAPGIRSIVYDQSTALFDNHL